jgi:hypothetical protein
MSMAESRIKLSVIKRLFAMSGNKCAFPACQVPIIESEGIVTGLICHIKARSSKGPRYDPAQPDEEKNSFENLVLLCGRHHTIVDADPQIYDARSLAEMKAIHERSAGRKETDQDAFFARLLLNQLRKPLDAGVGVTNLMIGSPGAIQGRTINLKTVRNRISITAPPGAIGANTDLSGYIQHLIKRYNEFAGSDPTRRSRFTYAAISSNIEESFGTSWRLLPINKASDVIGYLQRRISRTRQAKVNKGKGWKAFSTYEEYIAKHRK